MQNHASHPAACFVGSVLGSLLMLPSLHAVDGVIPNLTYRPAEQFTAISPQLSSLHLNQPSVYNGYAVFAGNGVHEVWDIANPYAPEKRATFQSNFRFGEAESHQVTYARKPDGTAYMATISGRGVDFWNVTNTIAPTFVGQIELPNINYGDVTGGIWGVAWHGNYLYAGATTYGLYVLDVTNPAAPLHVATLPNTALGGVPVGPLFPIGSTLVVTTPKNFRGIATVDISNPLQPRLLDSLSPGGMSYIGGFYNGFATLITPFAAYDVTTDPANITELGSTQTPYGEYTSFANHKMFFGGIRGGTHGVYKYDISNPAAPVLEGRFVGRNSRWDDQFSCPIGNLLAVADDQFADGKYVGGLIVVHDTQPDTTGPTVLKVFPRNGSTSQPRSGCVSVSLSEWPELATVDPSSFIVRPVGGAPLVGIWSTTNTILSFGPNAPLLPLTNYEIVLPAGGIRDLVGNPIASEFRSTFRTGGDGTSGLPEPPPLPEIPGLPKLPGFSGNEIIAPVPPTELGKASTFSLAMAPAGSTIYQWHFGEGNSATGPLVNHTYAAPGRYPVRLDIIPTGQVTGSYEAESATLSGGVVANGSNPGFTGTGFADFPAGTGADVAVTWNLNLAEAAWVQLDFRYANSDSSARPLHLVVNGGTPIPLTFASTISWNQYSIQSAPQAIQLPAGPNTIVLRATNGSVGGNIDSLLLPASLTRPTSVSFTHIVHRPLTTRAPSNSSPLALDAARATLWVANPDTDTVTRLRASDLVKLGEHPVGDQPENLAIAPDGKIFVSNHSASTLSVLNPDGTPHATYALPHASRPYGLVFSPEGNHAYLALQASGQIVRIDPATGSIVATLSLPRFSDGRAANPRALAIDAIGTRLLVTRFISPDSGGIVHEIDTTTFAFARTYSLSADPGPDTSISSRGIPNYLTGVAISPDGTRAWIPSKKDNILRGTLRDGNDLTHDQSVRSITSVIDLANYSDLPAERRDYDNLDRSHAVAFSPLGDLAFVTQPGNNRVEVVDTYTRSTLTQFPVGKTPTGILLDPVHKRLFVLNFLDRSLSAFNVDHLVNGRGSIAPTLAPSVSLIATESLSPEALLGKQLFYDATSTRLTEEGYMSCASCHLDGSHDGRVWDFTGSGEGLRNTIDLRGRAGTAHGRLHWSGNFDEVHDFENQIRNFGAGTGLMGNADFAIGTRSQTLGDPKAGLSADLDALATYVASLATIPASPHRAPDGNLTADAIAGRSIYQSLNCATCHGGDSYTDSATTALHDVGTRLGAALTGIDTPTLRGIWDTAPYFHDGSAPDLAAVLATGPHHNVTGTLDATETAQLIAWLQQIDGTDPTAELVPATIDFVSLPAKAPADPPFKLNATASSGLPVEFQSSDPAVATIAGDLLTIQGTGISSITATQPGNALHPAATVVERSLVVTPLDQLFATYLTKHFTPEELADPRVSGPLADLDHDGVPNLLEYALGATDPTDRAAAFPILTSQRIPRRGPQRPQFRITFLRRAGGTETAGAYISADLTYQPVASANLAEWDITLIPVSNPSGLAPAPDGFEWTSYAITNTPATTQKGYIKLKVRAE